MATPDPTNDKLLLLDELVKPKGELKIQEEVGIISQHLVNTIPTKFPNYKDMKLNINLLLHICNKIENYFKKHIKIDKKQLALNIFQMLFDLSPHEEELLRQNIEFLLSKGMIKKLGMIERAFKSFKKGLSFKF